MREPLVSIISFCKNAQSTIRRSVESVLNQTYQNFEFVVQDGASTDGTLEILEEYAKRDARIKLVSEPDSGHEEAFWKVVHRCSGEIMGTCLSDEELLPDAIAKAVEFFERDPELGAITGDGYTTDERGLIAGEFTTGEFNLVDYLFSDYCPFWPGSFFRTKALADIGLFNRKWNLGCLEFEIWCRLGTDHLVKHVSCRFSKYAIHAGQLSNTPQNIRRHILARLETIEKMFSEEGFFGNNKNFKIACMTNQLSLFARHAQAYKLIEQRLEFEKMIDELDKSASFFSPINSAPYALESKAKLRGAYLWAVLAQYISPKIRKALSRKTKTRLREKFVSAIVAARLFLHEISRRVRRLGNLSREDESRANDVARDSHSTERLKIYLEVANIFDSRGQIRQALEMWRAAESLNDAMVEGIACQANLKLPSATEKDIMDCQLRWASRHGQPNRSKVRSKVTSGDDKPKVKIGYHCSFFNGPTIRAMMQNVIEKHDSKKFVIYGYSPVPTAPEIRDAYDFFRQTTLMSDSNFVDLVRRDEIDIFVELSGFSPGNRFSAMASRCAPIQISYLNHTGTSGVPNVDYVLSDAICTPPGADIEQYFTEELYRLPGCFFCFDYDKMATPEVSPPPSLVRGSVTFGCFGSGGKINEELISYWAELLHQVPRSIFYIKNAQLDLADNQRFMIDRFQRFGIGPDRLRIEAGTDWQSLLRCYADVDVTLDTWPYCGGNTVAESFWQGVPVVTLYGTRFSSRYGASLVTTAGCSDLVAYSPQEYVDIAARLALDTQRLQYLRSNLRQMCMDNGLADSRRFAKNLEKAYLVMLAHHRSKSNSVGREKMRAQG